MYANTAVSVMFKFTITEQGRYCHLPLQKFGVEEFVHAHLFHNVLLLLVYFVLCLRAKYYL